MTAKLLSVRDVAVELGGQLALTQVSFDVPAGSCVGIVGETGAGKTLTCRVITGLIGRIGGRVISGEVLFNGLDPLRSNGGWRAIWGRKIAFVPQASLSGLDPVMRVSRQLEETIRQLDPGSEPRSRATELLEQVDMPNPSSVKRLYPHELSGGMRQRVMIALALAGRPQLLVADEPTTALDVTVQRGILALLADLRRATGMAVVMVTHDLAVVQSVAESVVVMYGGMVVENGPAGRVLSAPAHPYTRALLATRPLSANEDVLSPIPGAPPSLSNRPPGCPFAPRCSFAVQTCMAEVPPLERGPDSVAAACWRRHELP